MNAHKLSLPRIGVLSLALASPAAAGEGAPGPKPAQKALPDLVAASGKVTYEVVAQQTGKFTIKAAVMNPSQRPAGPFKVSVKYGMKWSAGAVTYDSVSIAVPGLGATSAKVVQGEDMIYYPPSIKGSKVQVVKEVFIKEVFVDAEGAITESDELNNYWPRRK